MVYVFVEHFLNDQGYQYFTNWVSQVADELSYFQGFLSIEILRDVKNPQRNLLLLKFDQLENLRSWSKSKKHQNCLSQLKPYMVKKQWSQIFESP
jgi:antibiotic biosynthesis monooxygenase (ABM) superfamily enzyme